MVSEIIDGCELLVTQMTLELSLIDSMTQEMNIEIVRSLELFHTYVTLELIMSWTMVRVPTLRLKVFEADLTVEGLESQVLLSMFSKRVFVELEDVDVGLRAEVTGMGLSLSFIVCINSGCGTVGWDHSVYLDQMSCEGSDTREFSVTDIAD
jgi:hypothetical protein